ncbi:MULTISPECIES: hypothetical protein [Rathayibacter]|uniref:hypothetical protein n=1 Tax=Rathayibacter TaxID=33886 RepID=UPI001F2E0867|nr:MULTISPECIES: hypothetical protein [Rathayibacter]MCJ1696509.1 hypothetical protein [Rathayibacter caricis]
MAPRGPGTPVAAVAAAPVVLLLESADTAFTEEPWSAPTVQPSAISEVCSQLEGASTARSPPVAEL